MCIKELINISNIKDIANTLESVSIIISIISGWWIYFRNRYSSRIKIYDGKFTVNLNNAVNEKFVVSFKGQNLPQTPKDVHLLINKNLYSLTYDHKEPSDENVFQYFYTIDSKYDGEIMDIEGILQCKLCVEYDDKLKFSTKVKKIHAFKDYQEQWHKGKAKVINNAVK